MNTTPQWRTINHWHDAYHLDLTDKIGLFRAIHDGKIVLIGQATSLPGGFAKRLSALAKGPDHYAGQLLYMHRHEVTMQIVELEYDPSRITRLRNQLIKKHQPLWNALRNNL